MDNNNKENKKSDLDKKRELISKDLDELLKPLLTFVILAGLFGFAGYKYCVDNNQNILHGIIFGSIFPLGFTLIKVLNIGNIFTCVIYTIAYIYLVDYVPTFVGIIILCIIIALFIISFVYIEKKDRTEEIKSIIYNESKIIHPVPNCNTQTISKNYLSEVEDEVDEVIDKDIFDEDDKLEYECELCFKKISYEEYESHDGYCEDCFYYVHIDDKGNYHDEELF